MQALPRLTTTISTDQTTSMITIKTGSEAVAHFGGPIFAKRKSLVTIREVNGTETFTVESSEGELTAIQGIDYVLIPSSGGSEYPCKIDIFHETWEETTQPGIYQKKGICIFVPLPKDTTVILETLEGSVQVSHPNYIAIGKNDEVYSYSEDFVDNELVIAHMGHFDIERNKDYISID
jgi:hypothetical protein